MMKSKVKLLRGDLSVDDRGVVRFVNDFDFRGVKRFYVVENYQVNFTRAWHAHRNEGKYVFVVNGAALVATVKIDNWNKPSRNLQVDKFILSEKKPAVLYIPPGYANGFKSLMPGVKIMFFSTSTLEESKNDDIRLDVNYFGDVWTIIER